MATGRALVTGVTGFTGRYVADALTRAGFEVFGTCLDGGGVPESGVRCYPVDIEDPGAVSRVLRDVRPDVVVHLAGLAFVGESDSNAFYRVNLLGTRNLLRGLADLDASPRCVLLASSANVYGNASAGTLDEDSPTRPANDYAVSKLAMEHMARLWEDRLPIVIVRPFNYTGVGQSDRFLLPKIVNHFRQRRMTIELGNLDVARDFSDVRSVAGAYLRLVEQAPAGQIFNICSGRTFTLQRVLEKMGDIAGYPIEVRVNPAFVRAHEVRSLRGAPARLRAAVGEMDWIPLEKTLEWMYAAADGALGPA